MEIVPFWIILSAVAVLFIGTILFLLIKKAVAKRKVAKRSTKEKITELNKDLEPFGFAYEEKQDIIYSGMYPWQRELGYCKLYDEAALALHMAIQCEPIYFTFDNRRWLIEFWKGQYGMTTGGEVGIYVTDKEDISVPGVFEGPFFECVKDEERLRMSYRLFRKGRPIILREQLHWWLTGFDVGQFSNPKRLSMEIRLEFPNRRMLGAFVRGLEEAGYQREEYRIVQNTVEILFDKPKTKQPYEKVRLLYYPIQWLNRIYCMVYHHMTKDFIKTLDKIDYLRFMFPWLYRIVIGIGKQKMMKTMFQKIKQTVAIPREVE